MEQFIILAVLLTSSLMISSTGALLSEKSGIANISIEGNMVAGAMFYMIFNRMFLGTATDPSSISDGLLPFMPLISMFLASFCGMLLSSLFAVVAVRLNGDHIITGTAYNLFVPALSTVMMVTFYSNTSPSIPQQQAFDITGNMIVIYPILFLLISIIAISFVSFKFNKTKKGLRLIASGENPFALETSGISVMSTRF
jgi:general nucleoside transport system permease protein